MSSLFIPQTINFQSIIILIHQIPQQKTFLMICSSNSHTPYTLSGSGKTTRPIFKSA